VKRVSAWRLVSRLMIEALLFRKVSRKRRCLTDGLYCSSPWAAPQSRHARHMAHPTRFERMTFAFGGRVVERYERSVILRTCEPLMLSAPNSIGNSVVAPCLTAGTSWRPVRQNRRKPIPATASNMRQTMPAQKKECRSFWATCSACGIPGTKRNFWWTDAVR
jgi:hypothetical protein